MIYFAITDAAQEVRIPRNLMTTPSGDWGLVLANTVDLNRIVLRPLQVTPAALYYEVSVEIPRAATPGEYLYELVNGGQVQATGLAVVGDYIRAREQIDNHPTYEQYNP